MRINYYRSIVIVTLALSLHSAAAYEWNDDDDTQTTTEKLPSTTTDPWNIVHDFIIPGADDPETSHVVGVTHRLGPGPLTLPTTLNPHQMLHELQRIYDNLKTITPWPITMTPLEYHVQEHTESPVRKVVRQVDDDGTTPLEDLIGTPIPDTTEENKSGGGETTEDPEASDEVESTTTEDVDDGSSRRPIGPMADSIFDDDVTTPVINAKIQVSMSDNGEIDTVPNNPGMSTTTVSTSSLSGKAKEQYDKDSKKKMQVFLKTLEKEGAGEEGSGGQKEKQTGAEITTPEPLMDSERVYEIGYWAVLVLGIGGILLIFMVLIFLGLKRKYGSNSHKKNCSKCIEGGMACCKAAFLGSPGKATSSANVEQEKLVKSPRKEKSQKAKKEKHHKKHIRRGRK